MPDSLSSRPKETVSELIRRHRRPLPAPQIDIENLRARAVAICSVEVAHRSRDFQRVERTLGLAFDRWLEPDCEQLGQFPHEAHAAAALLWLSHLQAHESQKRTPWTGVRFREWRMDERAAWFAKRRELWCGFLRQIERYRSARELPGDRPANTLTLSGPQNRVSKGGYEHHVHCPSFETVAARPPRDEDGGSISILSHS